MPISREDVIAIYRYVLGREPENDAVIERHARNHNSVQQFRLTAIGSKEFRAKFERPTLEKHKWVDIEQAGMSFDEVTHQMLGVAVTFAIERAADHPFFQQIRERPAILSFFEYIVRIADGLKRPLEFADIGANIGHVTLPFAARGAHVVAVEAHPRNFITLVQAIKANGFSNVTPVCMAVNDEPGLLNLSGVGPSVSSIVNRPGVHVSCDTLESILTLYGMRTPDIVKIDIEGKELASLRGSDKYITALTGTDFIYESNSYTSFLAGHATQDLVRWFEERNYRNYMLSGDTLYRIACSDAQPKAVADILATRRSEKELCERGLKIVDVSPEFAVTEILRAARSAGKDIRLHALLQEPYASDDMRRQDGWSEVLEVARAMSLIAEDMRTELNAA